MSKAITTAVIMAAGRGSRLRPYTEEIPKGFIEIGGQTLIERSIGLLRKNGVEQIVIGCGHKHSHYYRIKDKYGLTLFQNEAFATTDSLYTMVLAEPFVSSSFLLLESDLLYAADAIPALLAAEAENAILASGFTNSGDEVYIEADANAQLLSMTKDPAAKEKALGELVGISKISYPVLQALSALVKNEPAYAQKNYESGLVEMSNQFPIKIVLQRNLVWCEIDNEEHLNRAKEHIYPKIERQAKTAL